MIGNTRYGKKQMRKGILASFAILLFTMLSLSSACVCAPLAPDFRVVDEQIVVGCHGDLIPCPSTARNLGSEEYPWNDAYINWIEFDNVYLEIRPDLDYNTITAQGKPTKVFRSAYAGFSLPLYAPSEELFLSVCVPNRWNGTTDIGLHVDCYLDTANTDKGFQLELAWEHYTPAVDIVPDTLNIVTMDTGTGDGVQYQSYHVEFVVDYDIDTGDAIKPDDIITFRLRRIATAGDEITGEIVITHFGVVFERNVIGDRVP